MMKKQILLVSSGVFHPPLRGRLKFQKFLNSLDGFVLTRVPSLEYLPKISLIPAAVALYIHHKRISPETLEALERYVSGGGGLLAVHSATASFKTCVPYFEILGGRFTGHGAVTSLRIQPNQIEHGPGSLFNGIEPFTIKDELYLHELHPGIQPHFYTEYEGEKVPIVWTYRYGQGRVCYIMPGHLSASLTHPSIQEILRRAIHWVSGGDV